MNVSAVLNGEDGRLGGRASGLRPRPGPHVQEVRSGPGLRARSLPHSAETPACWVALLALTLFGCADGVDVRASDLEATSDGAYVAKRDAWVAELRGDREARAAMNARVRTQAWSDASWREDAVIASVVATAADPEVAAPFAKLKGLDPRVYLQRRDPKPELVSELLRARVPAPVLIERYRRLDALQQWAPAASYAASAVARVADLRAAERAALREGILHAVGDSRHAVAVPFLASVATDSSAEMDLRRVAAIALGRVETAAAAAALRTLVDTASDDALVASALAGASRLRVADGLAILRDGMARDGTDVRRAALAGLGAFASARAWQGVDATRAEALRAGAARSLVAALRAGVAPSLQAVLLEAIATADHPDAWRELGALARDATASEATRALARNALRYHELAERRRAR